MLDFIGNYEKAGQAPYLLSGQVYSREKAAYGMQQEFEFPEDCIVDFDMRLIDLFQEMAKRNIKIKERVQMEYFRIKGLLDGRVPNRMDLFTYMDDEIYQICMSNAKENLFRHYLEYLHQWNELTEAEEKVYGGIGKDFLGILETTNMQKSYKMPILKAFYNDGDVKMAITEADMLSAWKKFFSSGTNWKDLEDGITYGRYQEITDKQHLSNAKRNPVKFLKSSGEGFFVEKEGYVLALREELKDVVQENAFKKHMKDIIEYRTMEYYRRRYEGNKF